MKPMKPRSADPTRTALLLGLVLALGAAPAFAQDDYEGDAPGECTDRADNDRDGKFDCDDEGCAGSPDCKEGASSVPAPAAAPIPDTELRSEEGFVFPSPTALADYRTRRVGLTITTDEKTVAWGLGGAGFGTGGGVLSSTKSARRRLLRIDGTGATFRSDYDFLARMDRTEWVDRYDLSFKAAILPRVRERRQGLAVASGSIFLGSIIAGLVINGVTMKQWGDTSINEPTWWYGSPASLIPMFIGFGVSSGFLIGAASADSAVALEYDLSLTPDVLLNHVDSFNRRAAADLGASAETVGPLPEEPDPSEAAEALVERQDRERELTGPASTLKR
jgi:hypothetical protein